MGLIETTIMVPAGMHTASQHSNKRKGLDPILACIQTYDVRQLEPGFRPKEESIVNRRRSVPVTRKHFQASAMQDARYAHRRQRSRPFLADVREAVSFWLTSTIEIIGCV